LKIPPPTILLIAGALLASAPSHGSPDPSADEELPAIFWPQIQRPEPKIRSFYKPYDGSRIPMISIEETGLDFEISERSDLRIGKSSREEWATEIHLKGAPGVRMSITVFDSDEFLPNLEPETWEAYKRGLLLAKPSSKITFEASNLESRAAPYIFGGKFRQLAYTDSHLGQTIEQREIFAYVKGRLVAIAIRGKAESIRKHWTRFDHFISRLTLG